MANLGFVLATQLRKGILLEGSMVLIEVVQSVVHSWVFEVFVERKCDFAYLARSPIINALWYIIIAYFEIVDPIRFKVKQNCEAAEEQE